MDKSEETHATPQQRFYGYPKAVEGPNIPYRKETDSNPVFRGTLLVIGAWLVTKLNFVQKYLWSNAGFNGLQEINLDDYKERWDPTVIPVASEETSKPKILDLESLPKLPLDLPGRYLSIADYHAKYLSGELTPLAVAESLLPLIRRDAKSPTHHSIAFTFTNEELVLAAAKASTERYKSGKSLGVLDGVPTAVKDEADVAGYRSASGRKPNDDLFPIAKESSWPIQKLQEAGAIVIGKCNMHEIGADTTNNNCNWGTPRNPHNERYYTGGSSGGSAYAVSSGLVPFAHGADGGGSIRIPASFCGVYGLKTSHNRLEDQGSTTTVSGPIAGTMADLEASYRIMSIPNPDDPTGALFAPQSSSTSQPKVIGICKVWFERADPAVKALCQKAVDYYRNKLGYRIVDINIPHLPHGQTAHAFTILSEMVIRARNQVVKGKDKKDYLAELQPANQVLLAVASQTPTTDYLLAQQLRQLLMQHLAFLYKQYPGLLIVTPTSPMAGWPIGSDADLKHGITDGNMSIRNMEYVWMANFCGNPAISVPVGYAEPVKGKGNIPVGLMAMGEWGAEDQLLEWGYDAEAYLHDTYEGGRQRPANWVDVVASVKA